MTEGPEDRPGDGETSEKRIVIANGMDLDKQYFYEITKVISRDGDLQKLSLSGPPIWGLLALVGFLIAAWGAVQGVRSVVTTVVRVINLTASPLWTALTVLGAAVIAVLTSLVFRTYLTDFVQLGKIKRRFVNLSNVLRWDVWQNLNYWHPFTSHLSDRDPIVPLSAGLEYPVSSIYSDGPHYQNVFIDALYVEPEGDLSWPQRISYRLYRWSRFRHLRRALYAVAVVATLVLVLQLAGVIETPTLGPLASVGLGIVLGLALVLILLTVLAWNYLYFHLQFFSDSAGLSRYDQLLNPADESILSRGEEVGLSNSMNGYGVFYVSRFIASLFGRQRYDVTLDPETLAPGESNGGTAFPATGFASSPGDEHATAAAAEILWASLPADAVRTPPAEPDITLNLTGVDYYTIRERNGRETLVQETAGNREGYRLPVKKFMSVRHGFDAASLRIPDHPEKLLYADSWSEDELHTLYVGGGEHQQAINKLLLVLKSEGYRNIDIRENAFAVGSTPGPGERLQKHVHDESSPTETSDRMVHLPIEYFVSLVSGGNEFFRQEEDRNGHGFLLLYHELDSETDQREYAHVLIGMSAPGTKIGALFWQHLVASEFTFTVTNDGAAGAGRTAETELRHLEEDVVYFFDAPGPTGHQICQEDEIEYDDIGELYTDTAWSTAGLDFEISRIDGYESVERATADTKDKTLGTEYFELDITGVGHDS